MRKKAKAAIFDIDGTLSSAEWRAHLVETDPGNRKWSDFHGGMVLDRPIDETVKELRRRHKRGEKILIVTLRPERFREHVEEWFERHDIPFDELHLRPPNNYKHGPEVKRAILNDIRSRYEVTHAFDDHPPMVEMYRKAGVPVTQVIDPHLPPEIGTAATDPKYPDRDRPWLNTKGRVFVIGHVRDGVKVQPHWRELSAIDRLTVKLGRTG